jgi:hypothetical protein
VFNIIKSFLDDNENKQEKYTGLRNAGTQTVSSGIAGLQAHI